MNNTLTGLGLALVLALIAALIGPWFVNWSAYREAFAAQASALVGAPVKVAGAVDARLLPSPYIRFRGLSAGAGAARLAVDEVEVELAIAPLLRGEVRAERVRLVRPRLGIEIAADGTARTAFSGGPAKSRAGLVSFDRVEIVDGAIDLATPGGLSHVGRIQGVGQAASLAGPYRFEGEADLAGRSVAARISTARADENGVMRLKLALGQQGRPETLEADGALTLSARPRFDGRATLLRPAPRNGGAEPWRIAAAIKAEPGSAAFDALDIVYGPEERAIRFGGRGAATFGPAGSFELALETRQLNLDRFAGENGPKTPAAMLAALVKRVGGAPLSWGDGKLAIDIRGVVLAGEVIQNLKAEMSTDAGGWRVERAQADLPARAKLDLSGAVGFSGGAPGFSGDLAFETMDLPGFRRWLAGGGEEAAGVVRRLALKGRLSAGLAAAAVEDAELDVDGARSTGRLAWRAGEGGGRPRIEAALTSEALDLDALGGERLLKRALVGGETDALVAIDAASVTAFGVRMADVSIDGALGAEGIDLKRLSVRDADGARIEGAGRIAQGSSGLEGRLGFDVASDHLAPLLTLARAAGAPEPVVEALRSRAGAIAPIRLRFEVEAGAAGERVSVQGDAAGGRLDARLAMRAVSLDEPAELDLKVRSPDGRRLAALLGFEVSPVVEAKGGELSLKLSGAPAKGMAGEARFSALGLDLKAKGAAAFAPVVGLSAQGDVTIVSDDLSALAEAAGRLTPGAGPLLPASLSAKVSISADGALAEDIAGSLAGRPVRGRLALPADPGGPIEGSLQFEELPAAAIAALSFGSGALAPAQEVAAWPSTPFGLSPVRGLTGRVAIAAARMPLGGGRTAKDVRFGLALRPSGVAVEGFSGALDGGRLTGTLNVARAGDDATVSLAAELEGASAEMVSGLVAAASPVAGTADLKLEAQGTGKTVAAVVAALTGAGSVAARDLTIRRLDVAAIDAVEPLVENGLALDAPKVVDALGRGLDGGDLVFERLTAPFTISGGVIRTGALAAESATARLGGSVALDLRRLVLDADLALQPNRAEAQQIGVSFEGPLASPKRRIDATAFTGWLSVRAVERETRRIEAMEADIAERARLARLRAEERKRIEREEEAKRLEEAKAHVEGEKRLDEERRKQDGERRKREGETRAADSPSRPSSATAPSLPSSLDLSAPGVSAAPRQPAAPPTGIFGDPGGR